MTAFAAALLFGSSVASLEVPVRTAKQAEAKTIEYNKSGRRPTLSVSRAPVIAAKKQITGLMALSSNCFFSDVIPAFCCQMSTMNPSTMRLTHQHDDEIVRSDTVSTNLSEYGHTQDADESSASRVAISKTSVIPPSLV